LLYFVTLLAFNPHPPTEGFLWDDLRKILHGGQKMANVGYTVAKEYCR